MSSRRNREHMPDEADVYRLVKATREDCGLILKFEVVFGEEGGVAHARAFLPGKVTRADMMSHTEKVFYRTQGITATAACYHAGLGIYAGWKRDESVPPPLDGE